MRIQLKVTLPDQKSFCSTGEGPTVRIGRSPECQISLAGDEYQGISWFHVLIELKPTGAFVSDCGSTNGTYVNDRRLEGRTILRVGDVIRLGQAGPAATVLDVDLRCPATEPSTKRFFGGWALTKRCHGPARAA